jgi:TatA/E family protein of Tat protein translocase
MFGHMPELLIILALALIVFGPDKLPEVASTVGKAVREVRSALESATHPEDHEVPEDFSSYYYESLARAGEEIPEADVEGGPSHYPFEEDPEVEAEHPEPIPIRADRPDVFPDDVEAEPPPPDAPGEFPAAAEAEIESPAKKPVE